MKRKIVKISLNPDNPLEAELIAALKPLKNKSAHLKLAAYYYWDILESLVQTNISRFDKQTPDSNTRNSGSPEINKKSTE